MSILWLFNAGAKMIKKMYLHRGDHQLVAKMMTIANVAVFALTTL